ncbi:unnamed protein product [Lampetra fluviatilis]
MLARRDAPSSGLVPEMRTHIRTEPFSSAYSLTGRELGRGKFAVVRMCVELATGRQFAAKFVRKRRKGQDCRAEGVHEVAVLEMALDSPHIIRLHDVYETPADIVIVLEYAAGGEIFQQCVAEEGDGAFTESDVVRLMRQVLDGIAFLHRHNVVHLDLKPQNILLTSAEPLGDIRIVDLGLSRRVSSAAELREIMGTPEYVAPEILNYDPITTATDMWSMGVLAYVMLTGESPFLGGDNQETFLNVSQVAVSYDEETFQGKSPRARHFIQSLLLKDPRCRATAEDCLRHPWLRDWEPVPEPISEAAERDPVDSSPHQAPPPPPPPPPPQQQQQQQHLQQQLGSGGIDSRPVGHRVPQPEDKENVPAGRQSSKRCKLDGTCGGSAPDAPKEFVM